MKTTYMLLAIMFLLSFNVSIQAQMNNGGDILGGVAETVKEKASDALDKYKNSDVKDDIKDVLKKMNFWEKFMQGDIQLKMIVKNEKKGRTQHHVMVDQEFLWEYSLGDDELFVEFDWDNRALLMIGNGSSTEYYHGTKSGGGYKLFGDEGIDNLKQYTDKDGYWYVPFDDPNEQYEYIKFNAKKLAVSGLQGLLDLSLDSKVEDIKNYLFQFVLQNRIDLTMIGSYLGGGEYSLPLELIKLLENFDENNKEYQEELRKAIKVLLSKQFEDIGGFPIFIHWAFIYSPEVIRAHYGNKISEDPLDCNGLPKACSKFTVLKGEDKGKSLTFDHRGRLKRINALKEGSAVYYYDKDVTVNIPPAIEFFDFINKTGQAETSRQNADKRKRELREFIEKNKEKFEREKTDKEEIKEFINEELNRLKVEKERAITKQERDEIQERIDLIEEWLNVY